MPVIDPKFLFAVLGPVLLALGLLRWLGPWRNPLQGRIWALVGLIFSAVALWLWWKAPPLG